MEKDIMIGELNREQIWRIERTIIEARESTPVFTYQAKDINEIVSAIIASVVLPKPSKNR